MKPSYKFAGRFLVSATILWFCLKAIDIKDILIVFYNIDLPVFCLALFLNIIGTIVLKALVTDRILKNNKMHISLINLININFITRFYTIILPRGVATGIRWLKYRKDGSNSDAFILVVFENILHIFILMLTASVFLSIDMDALPHYGRYALCISIVGLFVSATALLVFFSSGLFAKLNGVYKTTKVYIPDWLTNKIDRLVAAAISFQKTDTVTIFFIFGLSLLSYFFFVLSPYVLSLAMGIKLEFIAIAWIRSLVLLMALVPITVAGLGVREAGYIALLNMYAISRQDALAFSIGLFVIQILIGCVGGLSEAWQMLGKPFLFRLRKKEDR